MCFVGVTLLEVKHRLSERQDVVEMILDSIRETTQPFCRTYVLFAVPSKAATGALKSYANASINRSMCSCDRGVLWVGPKRLTILVAAADRNLHEV